MASAAWIDAVKVFHRVAKQISDTTPGVDEVPSFVDVGGGYGNQSTLLGKRYPNLLHRIVLQDLTQTLNQVSVIEGIQAQEHDFFTPQPIKVSLLLFVCHAYYKLSVCPRFIVIITYLFL